MECVLNAPEAIKSVFLTSDNSDIRAKVEKKLADSGLEVVTIPDSIIHIKHAPSGENQRIQMVFEFTKLSQHRTRDMYSLFSKLSVLKLSLIHI